MEVTCEEIPAHPEDEAAPATQATEANEAIDELIERRERPAALAEVTGIEWRLC